MSSRRGATSAYRVSALPHHAPTTPQAPSQRLLDLMKARRVADQSGLRRQRLDQIVDRLESFGVVGMRGVENPMGVAARLASLGNAAIDDQLLMRIPAGRIHHPSGF